MRVKPETLAVGLSMALMLVLVFFFGTLFSLGFSLHELGLVSSMAGLIIGTGLMLSNVLYGRCGL
ncbi:MAG: hypothetical protein ACON5B_06270 [Myxococcota bacterium]